MAYRRPLAQAGASRRWRAFLAEHQSLVEEIGLPDAVLATESHWADFLMHGWLDHHKDPTGFSVTEISPKRYPQLVELVRLYFAAGYPYFTVMALEFEDQARLQATFGTI